MKLATKDNIKELKKFAVTMSIAIPCVFLIILPLIFGTHPGWWSFGVSIILMTGYLVYPKAIFPFYWLWMKFALIMGWLNTHIILTLVFFLLILPIGLILRILGKLQYRSNPEDSSNTLWKTSNSEFSKTDLERPF